MKKKYVFKTNFKNMSLTQIKDCLNEEVFSTTEFNEHVIEVAIRTNVKEHLVKKILTNYITNIHIVINSIRIIKTKINIYAFLSLTIKKGKRF